MELVIPVWDIPTLPVAGSTERFPVRRVFCMGLNYLDHKREMGITGDVPPFVFTKAVNHVVPCEANETTTIRYPGKTQDYQWECEYTVAIGKRGANILTGTPGGIGPVKPGDIIEAGFGDLTPIKVRIGS